MEKIDYIIQWYTNNVNYTIPRSFFEYIINHNIVPDIDKEKINDLLLAKNDNNFIICDNKYQIKENRKKFINQFTAHIPKIQKFKIDLTNRNHVKLIKLN